MVVCSSALRGFREATFKRVCVQDIVDAREQRHIQIRSSVKAALTTEDWRFGNRIVQHIRSREVWGQGSSCSGDGYTRMTTTVSQHKEAARWGRNIFSCAFIDTSPHSRTYSPPVVSWISSCREGTHTGRDDIWYEMRRNCVNFVVGICSVLSPLPYPCALVSDFVVRTEALFFINKIPKHCPKLRVGLPPIGKCELCEGWY